MSLIGSILRKFSEIHTVPHNDMGALTLRGWLAYLNGHAIRESGRL